MEAVDTPQDTPQQRLEKAQRYHQRFDDAVRTRMIEVGLPKLKDVARAAGITVETLGALRKGQNYPRSDTAWGIDGALRWERNPSSTLAIFNGGDPVALPDEPEKTPEEDVDPDEQKILAMPHLPADKKQAIIQRLRANRQAALEEAEALDKLAQVEGPKPANGDKGRRSA
jgi:transcriptional regulator with XRE-family HTH domain